MFKRSVVRLGVAAGCALAAVTLAPAQSAATVCADSVCAALRHLATYAPHSLWKTPNTQALSADWGKYVQQQRVLQQEWAAKAAQLRRREQQLQTELEAAKKRGDTAQAAALLKKLQTLQRPGPLDLCQDVRLAARIHAALPRFSQAETAAEQDHGALLRQLAPLMSQAKPTHAVPVQLARVLILGLSETPADARRMLRGGAQDPFDGRAYDRIYGLGTSSSWVKDLPRVIDDHALLQADMSSHERTSLYPMVRGLQGARVGELVCHSNGCAIAESLIREGVIRVKMLRMLGGDGALMHVDELERLAARDKMRVAAYATVRDPVPLLPLGWDLDEWASEWSGACQNWLRGTATQANSAYQVLGLGASHAAAKAAPSRVKVVMLSAPGGLWPTADNVLRDHSYSTYYALIIAQRRARSAAPRTAKTKAAHRAVS